MEYEVDMDAPKSAEEDEKKTSAEGEDFEIEVVDDTPERDRGRKALENPVTEPTDEELAQYSDKVQGRIKELTHARHDERRKAEKLARERDELDRFARATVAHARKLEEQLAAGGKVHAELLKSEAGVTVEAARKALREAHEAFDTDAIVAAQEALFNAQLKQRDAERFVVPQTQNVAQSVAPAAQGDVYSQQEVPTPRLSKDDLSWQARNQWFRQAGYEEESNFALGVHEKLVSSGVAAGSPEYYERLDARMQSKFPEIFGGQQRAVTAGNKRPANVVASASRASGSKKVTLTATQVALAEKHGIPLKVYAAEMLRLENDNG